MHNLLNRITSKKRRLDAYRPIPPALVKNLDEWYRVELTYTSNAIEGNTLTRQETALVVEKGITVAGKSLTEHLEATNHAEALDYVKTLVRTPRVQLTEDDLLQIHRLILQRIDDPNTGRYRNVPVRIAGSPVVLPNYVKVPGMMKEFIAWLRRDDIRHPVERAAEAHYRLVSIHPFVDGNGRTARLLMNLLLLQAGYPVAIISPADRQAYIAALEKGQTTGDTSDYYQFIYAAIDRSLDAYLDALEGRPAPAEIPAPASKLISRHQLASLTGIRPSTIMYYTDIGLLPFTQAGPGLARRYDQQQATSRLHAILSLRARGFSLEEIKRRLESKGHQSEHAA